MGRIVQRSDGRRPAGRTIIAGYHWFNDWGRDTMIALPGLTMWAWLLQPFVHHLSDAGLGTISEIFEGDPPHYPRGCIAQTWSVAEVLRVWRLLDTPRTSAEEFT